ncbi:type II toxin-antitoxin system Phd/YefM family antitoxin [Nocardiopsis baichengensis]|uniref:type II toxin-antitoxin system Phd/YefM family antitoxin n=1 Tax=Nocardiopsis baichengensis TaxID=280240 RepID=UPI0003813714|nr:type II toxin-antitoxin system prevent-host-death family antitoxin [Nocardiopsis baichengensis]
MKAVTYDEFRANDAATLESVVEDREEAVITRPGHEPVVLVALSEYEALLETARLLRGPGNAYRSPQAESRNPTGEQEGA